MLYELATLSARLGSAGKAIAGIDAYVKDPEAKGVLLGCWVSELGDLNRIFVLRSFDDAAALDAEQCRGLMSSNPFNCGDFVSTLSTERYAPFPFLAPVTPGRFGSIYEIRTYMLKMGGVAPTIAAWEAAIPERTKLSPLVIAMYALEGRPRFTHIWPFESLNDRGTIRAASVEKGIWPPKGGPEWLTGEMQSTIALPSAISPLT
jgi:hypothetical protein